MKENNVLYKRVKVGSCDDAGVMTGDGVVPATTVIVPSSWLSKPNSWQS